MCQKDACGAALTVPYNFILTFLPGTCSGPAGDASSQPLGKLGGGEAECCEWQGGTSRVTAESRQPRRTRGHPAGSDPAFPLVDWGALLLGDGPVTQWQEPKFPKDFREDSCPPDLDQPRWEQGNWTPVLFKPLFIWPSYDCSLTLSLMNTIWYVVFFP